MCGDCSDADPKQFDVMIVDPPYSAHVHKNATSQSPRRGTRHRDLGFEHLSDELRETIAGFASQVRRWSLIYSDVEGLHAWRKSCIEHGASYIRPMAWVRWSMPQLSGDRPTTGFELVTCYWGSQGGRKSWNGPGNLTHLDHKCLRGEGKHKAEKPLDQMLDLVTWFSNPGDKILDPCAGAGTVGLACKILGREYVGFEIDPVWAEKAAARLAAPLSERDQERYQRWLDSQVKYSEKKAIRDANTAKVRRKNARSKDNNSNGVGDSQTASGASPEAASDGGAGSGSGETQHPPQDARPAAE